MAPFIIYFIFIFWILFLMFLLFLEKGKVLSPAILFLTMALIDVFLPSIFVAYDGFFKVPVWANELSLYSIVNGLVYYSIFLIIFICFTFVGNHLINNSPRSTYKFTKSFDNMILMHMLFLLGLSISNLFYSILSSGGIEKYLLKGAILSVASSSANTVDINNDILSRLPISSLFQALVGVAFYFRKFSKYKFLYCWVFPFFAILFSLATLLRGSLIYVIVVLVFAEIIRKSPNGIYFKLASFFRIKKSFFFLSIGLFFLISLFTTFRDGYRSEAAGGDNRDKVESIIPSFMKQGSGLMGVSSIVEYYGNNVDYLFGKTYLDMILLPIPRSIYKSKPNWYGIDDISRGLGWPESTQSAVTMPGEAYANFGLFGIFIAIPFGLFFGIMDKLINRNRIFLLLLGPIFYFQMFTVTNWMSFTGLINSFMVITFLSIYFIVFLRVKSSSVNS